VLTPSMGVVLCSGSDSRGADLVEQEERIVALKS
jgi:hypothetical protein